MTNITIGQYVPGKSWIYKLDPRLKILLTILWIVILFLVPMSIEAMLTFFVVFLLIILSTRVPFIKMVKGMKPIIFLMIFTFILQLIYTTSDSKPLYSFNFEFGLFPLISIVVILVLGFLLSKFVRLKILYWLVIFLLCFLVQWVYFFDSINFSSFLTSYSFSTYTFNVYEAGVEKAFTIVIRIISMISITSLLTFTTRYQEINTGFSAILSPLKYIKVPVETFSMMLSLSLRFIPTLVNETGKIMKSQASRGVDFQESNLKQKINQIVSLLVPLFVVSFRKADDLANAMEARGYIIDKKRSNIDVLKLKFLDYLVAFISICALVGVIIARIYL